MKPQQLLPIYRRNLSKYEAQGDEEKVRIQKALIARLEARDA